MKVKLRLNKFFASLLVLGFPLAFVACSNDDNTPPLPDEVSVQAMYGDYTGKMATIAVPPSREAVGDEGDETPATADITAKINKDTVYFASFPIKNLVLSVVDEETANKIVEAIGDVQYKIGYTPTLTEVKDSIQLVLDPKPLKLALPIPPTTENEEAKVLNIEVKVTAVEGANYEVETTNLKFKFNAEEILVGQGEEQVPVANFTPVTFDIDMKKIQ